MYEEEIKNVPCLGNSRFQCITNGSLIFHSVTAVLCNLWRFLDGFSLFFFLCVCVCVFKGGWIERIQTVKTSSLEASLAWITLVRNIKLCLCVYVYVCVFIFFYEGCNFFPPFDHILWPTGYNSPYTWSGSWVPFTHIQPTTRRILPYFIDYWWITCY